MLIFPAIGTTDPIRWHIPSHRRDLIGNIPAEAMRAQQRGMPVSAYSTFVIALHKLAATSPLLVLDATCPGTVRFRANPEPRSALRVTRLDAASLRARFEDICSGTVTGDRAYEVYLAWSAVFAAKPMEQQVFRSHLQDLVPTLAANAITIESFGAVETSKGLSL